MEALLRSTLPQFSTSKWKSHNHPPVCCFGSDHHNSIELNQSKNDGPERSRNGIWQLFTEAQRNILYLNRQRVQALQKLDEMKRENRSLLEKVKQMESRSQTQESITEDPFSISSELLLRIDSMVLTGILDTKEASGFRSLVINTTLNVVDYFADIISKSDAEILAQLRHFTNKTKMKGFHIINICTEMEPVASVGSLASYVTSLSHVLQRHGNLVEVILPMYATLNLESIKSLREIKAEFSSYFDGKFHRNKIWTGVVNGIGATFIQPVYYSSFFDTEKIYGYPNDFERFSYFSRASLDYILKSGKQPDAIHIHNWETSIVGPLFWDIFVNQGLASTRIVLTCQSFKSQCLEKPEKLALCGLDPAKLHRHDRFQDNSKPHLVNILKAGIVYSNKVIMMSSIHSKDEIVSTLSHGLEFALDTHKNKLLIAPFGYDDSLWDPSHDKFLPRGYTADDMRGKSVSKLALQQQLGLPENVASILIGYMFTEDSHLDLENLESLIWDSSRRGVQFFFVGVKNKLESFQEHLKVENVRFVEEYDESLLHLMFAGSDIILCSFSDPMLQVPIKAIKYGAAPVPVNVADDRLRNFVDPANTQRTRLSEYIINTFASVSLNQAIDEIKKKPSQWHRKILEAMSKDVSWDAECYDVHVSAYLSLKK